MKDKLPKGWKWKKLEEVGEVITGNTPPKSVVKYYLNGNIPFVKPPNLGNGIVIQTQEYVTEEALTKSRLIPKNSVMVCCIGSLGKVGIAGTDLITNQQINSINFNNKIVNYRFGYYYALTLEKYMLENANQAVVSIINKSTFSKYIFPLPPLSEQEQIVSILDKTFEKLDQAIALVKENIQKLKQLNESVLDETFGRFSQACHLKVSKISQKIQYGYTGKTFEKGDTHYLRITDIQKQSVNWKITPFSDISNIEVEKYKLNKGDIVFARTGATAGKSYLFKDDVKSVFASYLIRVVINKDLILPEYLYHYFQSNKYWEQVMDKATGAAQPNVNGQKLGEIKLPVPTLLEQKHTIAYLDQTTAKNQKLTQYYQDKLEALKRLKNSVLDSAFKGELRRAKVIPITQPVIDPYFARTKSFNAKKKADKQAMVIALAIEAHEKIGKSLYRTKGEKTVEVLEKHLNIDFGREAEKMTAGPADFKHLVNVVEPLADEKKWFYTQEIKGANYDSHKYIKAENFTPFMMRCVQDLKQNLNEVRRVINLFADMKTTRIAEVVATTYTGWNNLLIRKVQTDNEAIVSEARENWHEAKLKIDRQEFFDAIEWLKNNNLVPKGHGKEVN